MSRTRKDMSSSAFERKHGVAWWWDHPDSIGGWYSGHGQPGYRPPTPRGRSRTKLAYRRKYWGGIRNRVRMDLLAGREPDATRHRHGLMWYLD